MNQDLLRRKIIETAAKCFLKYGIKSTSMDLVSEVLHISKRTLYLFFKVNANFWKQVWYSNWKRAGNESKNNAIC